jgi:hypothetical protein
LKNILRNKLLPLKIVVSELTKDRAEKQRSTNFQCKRGDKYIPASVKHSKFIFFVLESTSSRERSFCQLKELKGPSTIWMQTFSNSNKKPFMPHTWEWMLLEALVFESSHPQIRGGSWKLPFESSRAFLSCNSRFKIE